MKISPKDLVRLIVEADKQGYNQAIKHSDLAYDEYATDFREAINRAQDETQEIKRAMPEALAQAKSRAYEEGYAKAQEEAHKVGYQRGLAEGQARGSGSENSYNSGLEAGVKAERERALEAEPKLSVWFMPCGPSPEPPEAYPPGIDKIKAIKAIRRAYGTGEGYGLKEVKALVEIEPGTFVSCGEPLPQSKAVALYLALSAAGFDPVLKA